MLSGLACWASDGIRAPSDVLFLALSAATVARFHQLLLGQSIDLYRLRIFFGPAILLYEKLNETLKKRFEMCASAGPFLIQPSIIIHTPSVPLQYAPNVMQYAPDVLQTTAARWQRKHLLLLLTSDCNTLASFVAHKRL